MTPIIEVDSLTKRYKGADVNAVDAVSFSVQPGEFFTLIGPNGAGKTTIISILTTTLRATSGSVCIAGFDVARDSSAVRRNVGIIFQKPSLDENLTAEENIRFHAALYGLVPFRPSFASMPRAYKDRVRELTQVVGLENELTKQVKTFSGGMKRKLEIMRSLMHRPRVLFLDEPTTGLDPVSRSNVWEYLTTVRSETGTTIFLTTHYLAEAEGADSVCVINKGRIASYGTPTQLKSDLVEEYVLLGAPDSARLRRELIRLGIPFTEDRLFKVTVSGAGVQKLLKSLRTPVDVVETHTPTLEDSYLQIVRE